MSLVQSFDTEGVMGAFGCNYQTPVRAALEIIQDSMASGKTNTKIYLDSDSLVTINDGKGISTSPEGFMECLCLGRPTENGKYSHNGVGAVTAIPRLAPKANNTVLLSRCLDKKKHVCLAWTFDMKNYSEQQVESDEVIRYWNQEDIQLADNFGFDSCGALFRIQLEEKIEEEWLYEEIAYRFCYMLETYNVYLNDKKIIPRLPINFKDFNTFNLFGKNNEERKQFEFKDKSYEVSYATEFRGSDEAHITIVLNDRIVGGGRAEDVVNDKASFCRYMKNGIRNICNSSRMERFPFGGKMHTTDSRLRMVIFLNNDFRNIINVPPDSENARLRWEFLASLLLDKDNVIDAWRGNRKTHGVKTTDEYFEDPHISKLLDKMGAGRGLDFMKLDLAQKKRPKTKKQTKKKSNTKAQTNGKVAEDGVEEQLLSLELFYKKEVKISGFKLDTQYTKDGEISTLVRTKGNDRSKVDFYIPVSDKNHRALILECRYQDSPGSTKDKDERLIYTRQCLDIDCDIWIVYDGGEYKASRIKELEAYARSMRPRDIPGMTRVMDSKNIRFIQKADLHRELRLRIENSTKLVGVLDNQCGDQWDK